MKFKLFGTEIYVSFLFAVVIAILLVTDRTGLILPTLIASAVHETGHLLAMWAAGCQPRNVRLIPASVQIVRNLPNRKDGELAIALCGPAANLAFYLTFRLWYAGCGGEWALRFALINLLLGGFNLIPVSGLDGGTVLRLLLEKKTDPQRAARTVQILSFALGLAVLAAGIIFTICGSFNLTVYITAVYLLLTALFRA